jgi:hypothetical protein
MTEWGNRLPVPSFGIVSQWGLAAVACWMVRGQDAGSARID